MDNEMISSDNSGQEGLLQSEMVKLEKIACSIEQEMFFVKKKIYTIGKLLSEAKAILSHGQFTKWIEERFKGDLPYSTAWLYAKIYERCECYPELIEKYPLYILMDVRKLPVEVLKLVKDNPEKFKDKRAEVMDLYKSFKCREIELPDFVEQYKEIMDGSDLVIPDEEAEPRIERNKGIYQKHLIERLKNQLGTVRKTIQDLTSVLKEAERAEVMDTLASDFDITLMGLVKIMELMKNGECVITALSQYITQPRSPETEIVNKRFRLSLPKNI